MDFLFSENLKGTFQLCGIQNWNCPVLWRKRAEKAAFITCWSKSLYSQIPEVYFTIKQVYCVLISDKEHMDSIWQLGPISGLFSAKQKIIRCQKASEVISSWHSSNAANRQQPVNTSSFSLSQTHTFRIFKSFGSNYKMSLIHNNTQMLEKQCLGRLEVTCHFSATMEIVNCLHKMLFFYNNNFWTR